MPRPTRIEANCETGEVLEIELTDQEIAEHEANIAAWAVERAERDAQALAIANLKVSAKAKLIAGEPLTAEEAEVIVF